MSEDRIQGYVEMLKSGDITIESVCRDINELYDNHTNYDDIAELSEALIRFIV